jgi:acetyl esterase/lipase
LARFPNADADGDGVLTLEEAKAFRRRENRANAETPDGPRATHADVKYGPYDRNVFDIWLPDSKRPTPLLMFIHGGGFRGGNKEKIHSTLAKHHTEGFLHSANEAGLAVASIQYRFAHFTEDELADPQKTSISNIVRDAARAVQFMRYHAADYNIDPSRVACFGGSAGAGTSLWLAFHDDLADPDNEDPVLRQSTRISAAGMLNGQFTYDVKVWEDEFKKRWGTGRPNRPGEQRAPGAFYGLTPVEYDGPLGDKLRQDVDMRGCITADDPPVFILTSGNDRPPQTVGQYNHHPYHAQLIEKCCQEQGVDVECLLPGVRSADADRLERERGLMLGFFLKHLSEERTDD